MQHTESFLILIFSKNRRLSLKIGVKALHRLHGTVYRLPFLIRYSRFIFILIIFWFYAH